MGNTSSTVGANVADADARSMANAPPCQLSTTSAPSMGTHHLETDKGKWAPQAQAPNEFGNGQGS